MIKFSIAKLFNGIQSLINICFNYFLDPSDMFVTYACVVRARSKGQSQQW